MPLKKGKAKYIPSASINFSQSNSVDLMQPESLASIQIEGDSNTWLKWTEEMHEGLLEALYTEFQVGKGIDNGGFR
jgi:hypothetical protein